MEAVLDQVKDTFVLACRIVTYERLADAAFNISCRFGANQMLIHPVTSPTLVTADNVRLIDIQDIPDMGQVHPSIYRHRPDVGAIVHVHALHAVAFSTLGEEFRAIHHYGAPFHGRSATFRSPGQTKSVERGDQIAEVLGDGRAVFHQGHGVTVVGKDLKEAVLCAIYVEEACKVLSIARQMGRPEYLTQEMADTITAQILKPRSQDKAWAHYVAQLPNW